MSETAYTDRTEAAGRTRRAAQSVSIALAAVSLIALAGCEQHPYPSPAPDEAAPPAQASGQLMGAPEGQDEAPPAPPAPPPPAADTPHGGEIRAGYAYGPDGPSAPPCPPDASYRGPYAPAVITCNAPIPNPTEGEAEGWTGEHRHHRHHRHHHWREAPEGYAGEAPTGAGPRVHHHHHHHHRQVWVARPPHIRPRVEERPASPPPPLHHHHHHPYAAAGVAAGAAHPTQPHAYAPEGRAERLAHARAHPSAASAPPVGPTRPAYPPPAAAQRAQPQTSPAAPATPPAVVTHHRHRTHTAAPVATEAQRYDALQQALVNAVSHEAVLNSPSRFTPNKTSEVSLSLPADFAQTVQTEAARQNLGREMGATNVTASLAGDGFAVAPEGPEAVPLAIGQPVVFRWRVTPQTNAKGPLQAQLSADVPSQGRSLPLGSVKSLAGVGHLTGRVIGVGLLVLVALILLGFAAGRRRPTPAGATRPRNNHLSGR